MLAKMPSQEIIKKIRIKIIVQMP